LCKPGSNPSDQEFKEFEELQEFKKRVRRPRGRKDAWRGALGGEWL
jgi:hypothetical protein